MDDFERIHAVYFLIKDYDNQQEYYLDAEQLKDEAYFGNMHGETWFKVKIRKRDEQTAILSFSGWAEVSNPSLPTISAKWSQSRYPSLSFKSTNMEVSIFTEMKSLSKQNFNCR